MDVITFALSIVTYGMASNSYHAKQRSMDDTMGLLKYSVKNNNTFSIYFVILGNPHKVVTPSCELLNKGCQSNFQFHQWHLRLRLQA